MKNSDQAKAMGHPAKEVSSRGLPVIKFQIASEIIAILAGISAPDMAADPFRLTILRTPDNKAAISWPSEPGQWYMLVSACDLVHRQWTPRGQWVEALSATMSTVEDFTNSGPRFYAVLAAPTPLPVLSEEEMAILRTLSPLPALPPEPPNAHADDTNAAALGQTFFFDRGVSGPLGEIGASGGLGILGESGRVSCQSCHVAKDWFIDTRSTPNNISSGAISFQSRNTPSLVNAPFYTWFNWNGGRDTLWIAGTSVGSMNGSLLLVAHRVFDAYRAEYDAVFEPNLDPALDPNAPDAARFPRPTAIVPPDRPPSSPPVMQGNPGDPTWMAMTAADQQTVLTIVANFAKAIGAYERLLVSRDAPFDKFIAGDDSALSDFAKRGAALFVGKARCIACHSGPFFTDNNFHNLGEGPSSDLGRFGAVTGLSRNQFNGGGAFSDDPIAGQAKLDGLMQEPSQVGAFRTPTLRNVAQTAPYMRTGRLKTLEEVIDFYNSGGGTIIPPDPVPGGPPSPTKDPLLVPLGLCDDEKAALVEFLKALTGEPVPAELTADTSVPPPDASPP